MSSSSKLFQPIQVGDLQLQHRIVLAPLTRERAVNGHVPIQPIVSEYYAQRASVPGTLLITEATFIAARASGFTNAPGIWSDEQIASWKQVTDAVHSRGSYIYLQLWALGRAAIHEELVEDGSDLTVVFASDIPLTDRKGNDVPRALTVPEIKEYVELYAQAAENAVFKAGFDGVEIHGANGYLIDQFLQDVSNSRTDEYGGSVENRARFALEIVDAVTRRVGQTKTGIRFSPWGTWQDMGMADPRPTFGYLAEQLRNRFPKLAYVHLVEPRTDGNIFWEERVVPTDWSNDFFRKIYGSGEGAHQTRLISAGGYNRELATKDADEHGDLIAFGRFFISNPDLPYRLKNNIPVVKGDRKTYFRPGASDGFGYTDYPFAQ